MVNVRDVMPRHLMDFKPSILELHFLSIPSPNSSSGSFAQKTRDVVETGSSESELKAVPNTEGTPIIESDHNSEHSYDS